MHMAGGGMHRGGRGDARASCASPLGTPLVTWSQKVFCTRAVSYEHSDQTSVVGREARIMSHMVSKVFFTRSVSYEHSDQTQWWDKKPGS